MAALGRRCDGGQARHIDRSPSAPLVWQCPKKDGRHHRPDHRHCSPACDSSLLWIAHDINGGFRNGTDLQPYTFVQQSDIDTAANSLKVATKQSAVSNINGQLQSNEHLVGDPQCSYTVTPDHSVGDKAPAVTVTVQATCIAKAST